MRGVPGCSARWYVLPRMISGPSPAWPSCCEETPLMVPLVPTAGHAVVSMVSMVCKVRCGMV
jgi:hypothetical protein